MGEVALAIAFSVHLQRTNHGVEYLEIYILVDVYFYQIPEIQLLLTLCSRWAFHFSGNCVPAAKKVMELSSCEFPLKVITVLSHLTSQSVRV